MSHRRLSSVENIFNSVRDLVQPLPQVSVPANIEDVPQEAFKFIVEDDHRSLRALVTATKYPIDTPWGRSNRTLLHTCASVGAERCMRMLIHVFAADINAADSGGCTAVHVCARSGRRQCLLFLIREGADLDLVARDGLTALHWLAANGRTDLLEELFRYRASPNARDSNGQTPLHVCAQNGHSATLLTLLRQGAHINARDLDNRTALFNACRYNQEECVRLLLEHSAHLVASGDGQTPVSVAVQAGHKEAVRVLVEFFPDVLPEVIKCAVKCVRDGPRFRSRRVVIDDGESSEDEHPRPQQQQPAQRPQPAQQPPRPSGEARADEPQAIQEQPQGEGEGAQGGRRQAGEGAQPQAHEGGEDGLGDQEDVPHRIDFASVQAARNEWGYASESAEEGNTANVFECLCADPRINGARAIVCGLCEEIVLRGMRMLNPRKQAPTTAFLRLVRILQALVERLKFHTVMAEEGHATPQAQAQEITNALTTALNILQPLWDALQCWLHLLSPNPPTSPRAQRQALQRISSQHASGGGGECDLDSEENIHPPAARDDDGYGDGDGDGGVKIEDCDPTFMDRLAMLVTTQYLLLNAVDDALWKRSKRDGPVLPAAASRRVDHNHGSRLSAFPSRVGPSSSGVGAGQQPPPPLHPPSAAAGLSASDSLPVAFEKVLRVNSDVLCAFVSARPSIVFHHFAPLLSHPRAMEMFIRSIHSQPFELRRQWFYLALHPSGPTPVAVTDRPQTFAITRSNPFVASCGSMMQQSVDQLKRHFAVVFQGEEGVGQGVLREWFQVMSREILNADYGLFSPSSDGASYQPNPASSVNPDHLAYFRFAGRVVGMAVFHKQLLDVQFTTSFFKHLTGTPIDHGDVEGIDPAFHRNMQWILDNNPDNIGLTFEVVLEDFGNRTTVELIPDGGNVAVTQANKELYVDLYCNLKMTRLIEQQLHSFQQGFYEFVPPALVRMFTPAELQLLISGLPDIDVEDWKANTVYSSFSPHDAAIVWFWEVVNEFSRAQRATLLQFVTGSSKVPIGGFANLRGSDGIQPFTISRMDGNPEYLPQSSTCFNLLKLPPYLSKQTLHDKVVAAIRCNRGFEMA